MPPSVPPSPGGGKRDRRAEPRYEVELAVAWKTDSGAGTAVIRDMSASGARVEDFGFRPENGEVIYLSVRFYDNALPVRVEGRVVRFTETGGFGVQFQNLQPRVRAQIASLLPKVGKLC